MLAAEQREEPLIQFEVRTEVKALACEESRGAEQSTPGIRDCPISKKYLRGPLLHMLWRPQPVAKATAGAGVSSQVFLRRETVSGTCIMALLKYFSDARQFLECAWLWGEPPGPALYILVTPSAWSPTHLRLKGAPKPGAADSGD